MSDVEDVPIREGGIRLGQLLKFVGAAGSGAVAAAVIAAGDVRVDGEVETRRGRQLDRGAVVEVATPGGVQRFRIT
jgi:ribosome-associated protein